MRLMTRYLLLILVLLNFQNAFAQGEIVGTYKSDDKTINFKDESYQFLVEAFTLKPPMNYILINSHSYSYTDKKSKELTGLTLTLDTRNPFQLNKNYSILSWSELNDIYEMRNTDKIIVQMAIERLLSPGKYFSNILPEGFVRFTNFDDNNIKAEFSMVAELCPYIREKDIHTAYINKIAESNGYFLDSTCESNTKVKGYIGELIIPKSNIDIVE